MDLMERFDIVSAFVPINLAAANNTGDYISLKNASRVACVLFKAAGTDNDDVTIAVQQAKTVAGGSQKNLLTARIWQKQGTQTTTGQWTLIEQTAANTYAPGDPSAQSQAIYSIVVDADQLDVDNGFDCIRFNCHDPGGNAMLGCGFYIIESLTPQAILPSPIVD